MATKSGRQYDLVLFGATGYTGKYTAECIVEHLPTNLRWAVAGRSFDKLQSLVNDLKKSHPDRILPGIETSSLELSDLKSLAKKTKVLINTVGPYVYYGKNVVQACAEEGTSYTDTTGEVPWVYQMVNQFQATAKKTGAVLIPQAGFESAVPDILAYAVAAHIQKTRKVGTQSITSCIYKFKAAASGGTLATVLSVFEAYSIKELKAAMSPYALSPRTAPAHVKDSLLTRLVNALFGVKAVPGLGLVTTSITGSTNAAYVNRSWGLRPDFYGKNFKYEELMGVGSRARGVLAHWALTFGGISLATPPVRWLVKKLIYQPGDGPSKEKAAKDFVELRAAGVPEGGDIDKPVIGKLVFKGSMYLLSGLTMTELARGLIEDKKEGLPQEGGFFTAASQGQDFVERLQKVGFEIVVEG